MFRLERISHPAFQRTTWTRSAHTVGTFRPYLAKNKWLLSGAAACTIGDAVVRLARPWPLKVLVDDLLLPATSGSGAATALPWGTLAMICGAILALGVLGSLFLQGQLVLAGMAGQAIASSLRRRLFGHLLALPIAFHRRVRRGELLTLLSGDVQLLKELLVNVILGVASSTILIVSMLVIMAVVNPQMALVGILVLPFVALTTTGFSLTMRRVSRRQREQEGELAGSAQETLAAIPVVKLFGQEQTERRRFASVNRRSRRSGVKMKRLHAGLNRNVELLLAVGMCVFVAVGAMQVQAGRLTVGELLVFLSYYRGFQKPLRKLAALTVRMAKTTVCGERILALLDEAAEPDPQDRDEGVRFTGDLAFEGVGFGYTPDHTVLEGVSFHVPAGAKVAVVGPSGAGKTTLLYLIAGLLRPDSGRIAYEGGDEVIHAATIRSQVSGVLQEPYLFRGSVADNLRYGRPEADDEDIKEALRRADARDFVRQMPGEAEAVLGDQGMTLSGGQRRRIAVARAMLREAPIVVLDEPLSGLDEDSREEVRASLQGLTDGRTSFWSTHDPALLADADFTLTVRDGKVDLSPGSPVALVAATPETARA